MKLRFKEKLRNLRKRIKNIYYPTKVIVLTVAAVFVFAILVQVVENRKAKEVAGVSTCDRGKQIEQLSYLYEAKAKTTEFREKMWGYIKYIEVLDQVPGAATEEQIVKDKPLINGAPAEREKLNGEISKISSWIQNVKECHLFTDEAIEEYKNFNKYDTGILETTGT